MVIIHLFDNSGFIKQQLNTGIYDSNAKKLMFQNEHKLGMTDEQILVECQYFIDGPEDSIGVEAPEGYIVLTQAY